ncbi:unnamed protein product [Miscanthus lutarioriparius]|uniref:[RNA-polymerase]-subunit kinase n=1 Tax=Miscanthus lutarioriparius TaxID=422564 RepID=A0A811RKL0_9POAL|nr:unnamed protein product [Miscanthus lutarioriparius]
MEHYERLGKIGEGTSGIVYKARDRRTGETVAIKRLRAGAGNGNGEGDAFDETFRREVRCLEACRGHPCLVELRAAHRDPAGAFLVMEYAGRSLAEAMRLQQQDHHRAEPERRPFPEPEARRVMRRLLEGVAAMHARGLLHRDLKPDNVLLDGRGGVKICDFGLSRAADNGTGGAPYTAGVATLWYRAPELILGSADYDAGVDTWALGCIMAELLAGGAPLFPGRSEMDQLNRVFDTLGMQDMVSWPGFARLPRAGSPLCRRGRPPSRLRELFPALSAAGFDVLAGLLACRPDRRLTTADALRCPWFADAAAAAPEALPDQPRASCCAGSFAGGVAGVAEAILA